MKIVAAVVALVGVGLVIWWCCPPDSPRKVAVLVSAEYADSGLRNNVEFWYDTVLTYCALRENGFADEDIYVLYGQGEDGFYLPAWGTQPAGAPALTASDPSKHYYMPPYCADAAGVGMAAPITDFPMTYPATGTGKDGEASRPRDLLECLANGCVAATSEYGTIKPLDERDFLYVWWKGHGITSTSDPRSVSFRLPRLTSVTADEVVGWLAKVRAGRRVLVLETCYSGCIGNTINTVDPPGILLASAACEETSGNSYESVGGVWHGVWTYWIDCNLQGWMPNRPPDDKITLPNGTTIPLSPREPLSRVFDTSAAAVDFFSDSEQTPLKKDECELAPRTTVNVADPVGQTPAPCPPH